VVEHDWLSLTASPTIAYTMLGGAAMRRFGDVQEVGLVTAERRRLW
jgi:hypothetical protein